MTNLAVNYESTSSMKKRLFNIDEITDELMAEPLKIDISNIIHTPVSVSVKMSRKEYTEKHIGQVIARKFNTTIKCHDEFIIFTDI